MAEPLSLAYRPKRFTDIVGQKATRAVLAKLVESGELPPSMIFGGVRGTGKTSAARIVAKAINCTERGDGFEPCGECKSCEMVEKNAAPFVIEIDAASHGSAEAMRQLVEDTQYLSDGWKVYVLDEVHSLSSQAFQVLLKTLEEPPPETSFILVTTEPEKIPETIHARSMMFRFNKITQNDIYNRMKEIAAIEPRLLEVEITDEALAWIAEYANGGMRDGLMTLDQASTLGSVTVPLLQGMFGQQSVGKWIAALRSGNPARAVLVADELVSQFGSVGAFIDRAILTLRAVLLAKNGHGAMPSDVELGQKEAIAMIRQLWKMRDQVRRLGPDDRAAVVALSAEMARNVSEVDQVLPQLTDAEMMEAISGSSS